MLAIIQVSNLQVHATGEYTWEGIISVVNHTCGLLPANARIPGYAQATEAKAFRTCAVVHVVRMHAGASRTYTSQETSPS